MKQNLLKVVFGACFIAFNIAGFGQGIAIGSSGSPPDPSAGLDVNFTNKGQLSPRMTTAQRDSISNPALGLFLFNTTTNCFNVYVGNGWRQWCGDCDFNNPLASNNGPICAGQTLNLMALPVSGATYSWTGPNGFTSNMQNPTIANASAAASGSYYVTATLNGCTSQAQITVATVNATPQTPTASNNGPVCMGQTLNLASSTINSASYNWTGPNGFTSSTQNASVPNVQLADTGTYSVVATVAGCNSAAGTTTVSVDTLPSSAFSPTSGKTDSTITFTPSTNGGTYSWTFASGSSSSSTAQNPAIYWTSGGTYNVSLTVTLNGCSSTTTTGVVITNAVTQQFNYTGNQQTWTVPNGITNINIKVWGAQGGTSGGNTGGLGGYATGNLSVTPGDMLYINVGGIPYSYVGGFNGGGDGVGSYPSGGGGGTDVRVGGNTLSNRVIVGGGGGGATHSWTVTGGEGGGLIGGTGTSSNGTYRNGAGGTQSAGGAQDTGYPGSGATDGSFGQGGRGSYNNGESSGGGGGWYGGGGGEAGGGGGGSGYIGGVTNGSMQNGVQTGNGYVIITY